jgi:phosphohistidine phosphatase
MPGYQLYLIRHAVAEERGPAWPDDSLRPLSAGGVEKMKRAMSGMARLGFSLDAILSSPLVRARQTADVVAAALQPKPAIVTVKALAPGGSPQTVLAEVARQPRGGRVALVGHEPDLGGLAAHLAGLPEPLAFKKGAICRIDVDLTKARRQGAIKWFLTPRIMRGLRK